jgi:hypothetical protein
MDDSARTHLTNLHSADKETQNTAFFALLRLTQHPVDWAYEVWDEMVACLTHKDNHLRAISSQMLCNLAKSDPEQRILRDFDKLFAITRDERFVTARHCMQALWKIGVIGESQRQTLIDNLKQRFKECLSEKNNTFIRHDIIQSLRNVYDAVNDEAIRQTALALIETEDDPKYRKKYSGLWKDLIRPIQRDYPHKHAPGGLDRLHRPHQ